MDSSFAELATNEGSSARAALCCIQGDKEETVFDKDSKAHMHCIPRRHSNLNFARPMRVIEPGVNQQCAQQRC